MAIVKRPKVKADKLLKAGTPASLRKGDLVVVIAGGNGKKRPIKGKIGRIKAFVGQRHERVVVEGVNIRTYHKKQTAPGKPYGRIEQEAPIHISNIRFYVEKIKKAVRLQHRLLEDGKKVRGYINSEDGEFVQV